MTCIIVVKPKKKKFLIKFLNKLDVHTRFNDRGTRNNAALLNAL